MPLHRFEAWRVLRRLRGGSSSPIVVETGGGRFVAKLRGAGHGVLALAAEVVVGDLAGCLGIAVPERVLIELPPEVESDDKNDELADLLERSLGTNLGLRWLEGAREPRAEELRALDDEFAARVLLLDEWTMNPDRTVQNPNIVLWNRQPWLLDHGAALLFHHDWGSVSEDSPRESFDLAPHVFAARRPAVLRLVAAAAHGIEREALARVTARIPDEFLLGEQLGAAPRVRAAYEAFLWKRLRFLGETAYAGS
jgi:hypothetical protein